MSALVAEEQTPGTVLGVVATVPAADDLCRDCGDALRDEDDVLCRWCEENRRLDPAWYEALPVA
jgi:hypothetical protein